MTTEFIEELFYKQIEYVTRKTQNEYNRIL